MAQKECSAITEMEKTSNICLKIEHGKYQNNCEHLLMKVTDDITL
mgnify:CR=1 FL=1